MNRKGKKSSKCPSPLAAECRQAGILGWHDVWWIALLGGFIFAAYANSFHSSWQFDDGANIVNNPGIQIQDLSWSNLATAMQSHFAGKRPVAYLSFAINYYFSKLDPFAYHLTSTAIHFVNAVLVCLFVMILLKRCYPELPVWYRKLFAFCGSALWACNPLQSQAVIYITQRMTLLVALFLLLALISYWIARQAGSPKRKLAYAGLCLLAFLFAVGSKENAFIFPVLLLSTELAFFSNKFDLRKHFRLVALALTGLIGLAALVIWQYGLGRLIQRIFSGNESTLWEQLMTEARIVLYYISQLLLPLPSRLAVLPDVQKSSSLFDPPTTFFSCLTILVLFALAIWQWKRRPLLSYAIGWYFIGHLVESTILPIELMFEHRAYFPSIGIFILLLFPLLEWGGTLSKKKHYRWIGMAAAALLLISIPLVWARSRVWADELSLWLDNTEKYPRSYKSFNNLGSIYEKQAQWEKAEWAYQQSLAANPDHPTARANLAILLQSRGRNEEALKLLENQNEDRMQGKGYYALGLIYANLGQLEKSIVNYRRAIEISRRSFPQAHFNLGLVNLKAGHRKEARRYFLQFLELWTKDPSDPYVIKARRQLAELDKKK